MTSVWPALWPPWKRTTTSARALSQSTILPLPSSPHWAPITATLGIDDSGRGLRWDLAYRPERHQHRHAFAVRRVSLAELGREKALLGALLGPGADENQRGAEQR